MFHLNHAPKRQGQITHRRFFHSFDAYVCFTAGGITSRDAPGLQAIIVCDGVNEPTSGRLLDI